MNFYFLSEIKAQTNAPTQPIPDSPKNRFIAIIGRVFLRLHHIAIIDGMKYMIRNMVIATIALTRYVSMLLRSGKNDYLNVSVEVS